MRAVLTDKTAPIYATLQDQSVSIATLHRDEEFELGEVKRNKRKIWVTVTLDSGVKGFISGESHIYALKKVQLLDPTAKLRSAPSKESALVKTLQKGDIFTTLKVEKTDEGGWVMVRDESNSEGYIFGKTKIRVLQEMKRSDAKRTLILGGVMSVLGVLFGIFSYAGNQQSVIAYYLALGFIVFGVLQLVQGFIQYRQAVAQKKREIEKTGRSQTK